MDYRKIEYMIYLFYLLWILFLIFITKGILKKRFQNIKFIYLKASGIVLLIVLPDSMSLIVHCLAYSKRPTILTILFDDKLLKIKNLFSFLYFLCSSLSFKTLPDC